MERAATDPGAGGFVTRALEAADAAALSRCFERCYGSSYGHPEFYDPARIAARVESKSLRSVVAVAAGGEIIGHTGLTLGDPEAKVVEAGNTVVDPAYRGTGVLRELGIALVARCQTGGLAGFMHYPTTAHEVMQKTAVRFGGVETGLLLAYVPADTEYLEVDVGRPEGRLAATVVYQPLAPLARREVAFPERHRRLLERLYDRMEAPREPLAEAPPADSSSLRADHNPRQGIARITVVEVGADLGERVSELAPAGSTEATYVDLPLDDPAAGEATDSLAHRGFTYCALLPEFAPGDVLRLQRLAGQPDAAYEPPLANEPARELLRYINADRER